ncbi:DUF6776 family protein [Massilia sp. W12]|uniref:DUF6776 family protein n=1 Tax=Massilia sp. W12 TaxID=3126507 RepID=UPI0030D2F8ED
MVLKRKPWWKRQDLASSKVSIQQERTWPERLFAPALALCVAGALLWWAAPRLGGGASGSQLRDYREQIEKLSAEKDRLQSAANAAESKVNIERAAQQQLARQAKTLEDENARLKEDLAFFESLLPADTGARGIAIRRVKIDLLAPTQLRYRLLVMQGGKGDLQFDGQLQLLLTGQQGGKSVIIQFPDAKANDADKYKLSFKHYQRLEGILTLPDGLTVKSVQARVLEKGQMRTQQSATL